MATVPNITNSNRISDFTATAGQSEFAITWPVIADSEILAVNDIVVLIDDEKLASSFYDFSGNAVTRVSGVWNGGAITLDDPLAGGERVIIYSKRDARRTGSFLEGKILPFTELDKLSDDVVVMIRDLSLDVQRSVKIDVAGFLDGETVELNKSIGDLEAGALAVAGTFGDYSGIRALNPTAAYDQQVVAVLGAEEIGDGGAGLFYISNDIAEDDDGGVTLETGTTRKARRIYSGSVDGEWYSLSNDPADAATNLVKLQAMAAEAARKRTEMILPGSADPFPITSMAELVITQPLLGHGTDQSVISGGSLTFGDEEPVDLGALNADVDILSTPYYFNLATLPPASVTPGTTIFLLDNRVGSFNPTRAYYYAGEAICVAKVVGSRIYCVEPLQFNYLAAYTTISYVPMITARVEGIKIYGAGAGHNAIGLNFKFCGPGSRIDGVAAENTDYVAIAIDRCVGLKMGEHYARKLLPDPVGPFSGNSYGVMIINSQNIAVSNGDSTSTRHAYTMGGADNDQAIPCRNVLVQSCLAVNLPGSATAVVAADAHGNTIRCGYVDSTLVGGIEWGGHENFYQRNHIRAGSGFGLFQTAVLGSELYSTSHVIEDNEILYVGHNTTATYGQVLDIGGPGSSTLDANTLGGGVFIFRNNRIRYTVLGASGTTTTLATIRNRGCVANMRLNILENEWTNEGSDSDGDGLIFIDVVSGSHYESVWIDDNKGDYIADIRDAGSVQIGRYKPRAMDSGARHTLALRNISSQINIDEFVGPGGAAGMINISSCSGARVFLKSPIQRGDYGSDAIVVDTDCTVTLDGWDLIGTNADINITSAVTALRYNSGYQAGTLAFNATSVSRLTASAHVGDLVESTVLVGAAIALTTVTAADITYIDLTEGKWDVNAAACYALGGATTVTSVSSWLSSASASLPTDPNLGGTSKDNLSGANPGTVNLVYPVGPLRVTVAPGVTTRIYLTARVGFAVSTVSAFGYLRGTRVQ